MTYFNIELEKIPQSVKEDMQNIIGWLNTNTNQELQLQATGMFFRPALSPDSISVQDRVIKILDTLDYDFSHYSIDNYIKYIGNFLQVNLPSNKTNQKWNFPVN